MHRAIIYFRKKKTHLLALTKNNTTQIIKFAHPNASMNQHISCTIYWESFNRHTFRVVVLGTKRTQNSLQQKHNYPYKMLRPFTFLPQSLAVSRQPTLVTHQALRPTHRHLINMASAQKHLKTGKQNYTAHTVYSDIYTFRRMPQATPSPRCPPATASWSCCRCASVRTPSAPI